MRLQRFGRVGCALALFAGVAQATSLSVALDVQGQGLALDAAGVGLEATGSGMVSLNLGGPVQAALLYWAGRDRPCPESSPGTCVIPFQPYKDQVLRFEGNLVTGTMIGAEGQPVSANGPINNIGYLADVTSIVQAKGTGLQTFSIADGDLASNLFRLSGATLLVIYTVPGDADSYRLMLLDGLDFAYGTDPTPGPTRVTVPVTFSHGASAGARQARLLLVAGDGESGRPDRVDVSNNASVVNGFDASAGFDWDNDWLTLAVPAGAGATTVQLFSEPVNQNPDSLLWEVAALRVPLPPPPPSELPGDDGCTPGYWKNHTSAWAGAGYSPGQSTGSVFSGAGAFPSLAGKTLLQTLQGGGGPGTLGAARILLRAAVAALLNAAHPQVEYPRTASQILAEVNAALASNSRDTLLSLAAALDADNNRGCPLS